MNTEILSEKVRQEIDHWIAKYPEGQAQSAVLSALMIVQENAPDRCLNEERMAAVADYLGMPKVAVKEVASFYSMYDHQPTGKYKISVCDNISCKLRGAEEIVKHLEDKLCISVNETTPDGLYTLKRTECLGACIGAPMCQINKDYHENLTTEKVDELLLKLK